GASIERGALLADSFGYGVALGDRCLRFLLSPDQIRIGIALGLFERALGARQLLGEFGDLSLQIRFIRFERRQDLGFQLLGLLLGFFSLIDQTLIVGLE